MKTACSSAKPGRCHTSSASDFVLRAASGKWRSPFAPETIIFLGPAETIFAGERRSNMPARFVDLDRQTPMFLPFDLHVSHRQQAGVQGSVCERVATGPAPAFEQGWHGQRGWHEAPSQAPGAARCGEKAAWPGADASERDARPEGTIQLSPDLHPTARVTNPFSMSHALLRTSPSQMAPAI
jgi:hypothetical protein